MLLYLDEKDAKQLLTLCEKSGLDKIPPLKKLSEDIKELL